MNAKQIQAKVQKFGSVLSAMVMPNIGVFIGWGLLAALFIDTGWIPNAYLNVLVSPILTYLLPALIGYTGGFNVHGRRGGVIGAFATMGVVVGADVTMLVGGMIMGPLAAWILKKFDKAMEGKVKPGLEMIVDNFSLGIIGFFLCLLGYVGVAPVMTAIQNFLAAGVSLMMEHGLLPLVSLFVSPSQVLFLNNAINHGIMIPLGIEQAAATGKSILFLVEANGANWVGLALAFAVFGSGMSKKSAPGAAFIMFFGGIAEVCFPYALTLPLTILGPMAGCTFSLFVLSLFGGGTVGPVSPGSVIAMYMMTPKSSLVANTIAYFGSLVVSFLVTGLMIKLTDKGEDAVEDGGTALSPEEAERAAAAAAETLGAAGSIKELKKVIFACDAGMGSSAMGVSILKTRMQKKGLSPQIAHVAVSDIPDDADVVVTNINLAERAKNTTQGRIPILTLSNFMDQGEYDRIVAQIQAMIGSGAQPGTQAADAAADADSGRKPEKPIFCEDNILLGAKFADRVEAIEACADIFINNGYASPEYKQDMIERDKDVSVYLGNGVAMPHGLKRSDDLIKTSGVCFVQVPEGVEFDDGEQAYILIGVAGKGDEHIDILAQVAEILMDDDKAAALRKASSKQEVLEIMNM